MSFDILFLCGAVIGAMFLLLPMKELKKEYFTFAAVGLSVIIFTFSLKLAKPIFSYINSFMTQEGSLYLKTLIKILGITLVTNLTSELASDFGMTAVSGKVEFAGKVAILMCALPIYDELFTLVGTVL